MTSQGNPPRIFRMNLTAVIITALVLVIIVQQLQIRTLKQLRADVSTTGVASKTRNLANQTEGADAPQSTRDRKRQETPLDSARREHLKVVEAQLDQISAPMVNDMASTMFSAAVKEGQSIVTGGYQTADGRNQFTMLKPRVLTDQNGGKKIEIDSNLIALSGKDTLESGLDSLATNAKNTLQHAESWEGSDVEETMELLRNSTESQHLGQPRTVVAPGESFSINMTSDDQGSYTLSGTADLSPDGSGFVLKARIEQKKSQN